jgi:DNA-3-methyladenine glycosylase II
VAVSAAPRRERARRAPEQVSFSLQPITPFRLDFTAWALRRRPDNVVDFWDGQTYRRVLVVGETPVEVAVKQVGSGQMTHLRVAVTGRRLGDEAKRAVRSALERLLGLRIDMASFTHFASGQPGLGELEQGFRGFKPPRYPNLFEGLINGISCQQLSLVVGIRLMNRLVERYGIPFRRGEEAAYALPLSRDVAMARPAVLRNMGYSRQKAHSIVSVSKALAAGELTEEQLEELDDEAAIARLRQFPGVGRWTAEYILLRVLGRLDVFPGDDSGARKGLRRWLNRKADFDEAGVRRVLARWQPYRGLVYFHLLLAGLARAGHLQEPSRTDSRLSVAARTVERTARRAEIRKRAH